MSHQIKVPEVGESITEVTVASWLKNDGDIVEMDEVLCELESDKATFELPAEAAGRLVVKAREGASILMWVTSEVVNLSRCSRSCTASNAGWLYKQQAWNLK